jgi:tRNA dimethylallyltransferase
VPHRRDQRARTWRQPNLRSSFLEHPSPRSLEKGDAGFERRDEVDFPIHRSASDFSNSRPNPEAFSKLIEHLVLDDRRLQIGHEKLFATPRDRLHQGIDPGAFDQKPGSLLDSHRVSRVENEITSFAWGQPDRLAPDLQDRGDVRGEPGQTRSAAKPGDQGEDHPHEYGCYSRRHSRHKPIRTIGKASRVLVIAGPTASGKTALALGLAEAFDGTVINADSQQIYRDLRILTARPDATAEERAPHRLYGFLDAAERGSVADWRALALDEIATATRAGRLPILVGGSGLYIRAIAQGLAPIPQIPDKIRLEAVDLHRYLGGVAFHERLARLDPSGAQRLFPGDRQRLVRAYEVVRATGIPLAAWQRRLHQSSPYRFATILLMPPRDRLYAACDARFVRMIEASALDEAAALARRGLDPDLPAMKAVGLDELLRFQHGEMALDAAIATAQRATRRYAKRQTTWFRHQTAPDLTFAEQFSRDLLHSSLRFVRESVLTG